MSKDSSLSRRAFARVAAATAAAVAILPAELLAQTPPPTTEATPPAAPATAVNTTDAEARIQFVFARYGSRLSEEQKAEVRRLINAGQGGLDALRAFALDPAVQPTRSLLASNSKRRAS